MKLARSLLAVLFCLLCVAPAARADDTVLPPPVIEKAKDYGYRAHVAGSSDPRTSRVQTYSGATCEAALDPGARHEAAGFDTGPDGGWAGSAYTGTSGDTAVVAVAEQPLGHDSAPSSCQTIAPAPEATAQDQTFEDRSGEVDVVVTRSDSDESQSAYVGREDGTATGSDYSLETNQVGFQPGQSTATLRVWLNGTPYPAGTTKTFKLLFSVRSGVTYTKPTSAIVTIKGTRPPGTARIGLGSHLRDFGAVATSDAQGRTTRLMVYGNGTARAVIKRVTISGSPAFDVPRNGCGPGAAIDNSRSCVIQVRFRPRTQGRFQAVLTIESNGATVDVPYLGTGGRVGYKCTNDYEYPARRDPRNPLMLPSHSRTSRDPLTGAKFFVDSESGLGVADLKRLRAQHRFGDARLLERITKQPETKRFSRFTRTGGYRSVRQLMCRVPVQHPGSIPLLSLYRLEHERCGNHNGDSPAEQTAYRTFVDDFARGVGRFPVVVFYEFDSIITTPCLNRHGLATRIAELRYGIKVLSKLPHAVVYLDAGAADALPYRQTASLLNRVGLKSIQGFFLNSTHYDGTRNEIAYGQKISRLVGGKHFVVSTAVNGRGPLKPRNHRQGNSVLCNPPGRGLGTRPTTHTRNGLVDAFAWIGNPGRSGGRCHRGDAQNGYWDLRYALSLARYAR